MIWLILKALSGLAATLALIVATGWAFRRWGSAFGLNGASLSHRIMLLETRRLAPSHSLHLVQVDGLTFLIATNGNQTTLIREMVASTPSLTKKAVK